MRDKFEIVDFDEAGQEHVRNNEFTSPFDASIAAVAFTQGQLPDGIVKREVRHVQTKEWVCRLSRATNQK